MDDISFKHLYIKNAWHQQACCYTLFIYWMGRTGRCRWRSTDPQNQPSPHLPPRSMWSLSCLQQSTLGFPAPPSATWTLRGWRQQTSLRETESFMLAFFILNMSSIAYIIGENIHETPSCDSVSIGKMLSYPFFRNLVCPGRRQVFAWRRIWCKEPTTGSGGHISSLCLLCEHKDFGLRMSACITGEHPASNAFVGTVVGGLFFRFRYQGERNAVTRLLVSDKVKAELFTFSWGQRRRGGTGGVSLNCLLSHWWAGITRSLMFTICFCYFGERGKGHRNSDVRKSAQTSHRWIDWLIDFHYFMTYLDLSTFIGWTLSLAHFYSCVRQSNGNRRALTHLRSRPKRSLIYLLQSLVFPRSNSIIRAAGVPCSFKHDK